MLTFLLITTRRSRYIPHRLATHGAQLQPRSIFAVRQWPRRSCPRACTGAGDALFTLRLYVSMLVIRSCPTALVVATAFGVKPFPTRIAIAG